MGQSVAASVERARHERARGEHAPGDEYVVDAPARSLSLLFVTPGYPPVVGGAEMHASRLAAALARRGHRLQVVTSWQPPMPRTSRWTDAAGIPVRAIGHTLPPALRPRAFVAGVATWMLAHPREYDAMHVFLPGLHVVSAFTVANMLGVPGAMMFGGMHEVPSLHTSRFGRLQLRTIRQRATRIVVLNATMKLDVIAFGIDEARIVTHPCSVDPAQFAPLPHGDESPSNAPHNTVRDAPVVLFTGRLVHEKALPTLIAAFALARRRVPSARLVLVGDGPLRAALETIAAQQLDDDAFEFCGALPPDGVRDQLQRADAFAFVSTAEGVPCSVIEAMSCALPCVVSDTPGVAQLVTHDLDALVVPGGDEQAIADALVRVLSDRALRTRLGAAARRRVLESFSSDHVAANHERMYFDMLTAGSRGGVTLSAV